MISPSGGADLLLDIDALHGISDPQACQNANRFVAGYLPGATHFIVHFDFRRAILPAGPSAKGAHPVALNLAPVMWTRMYVGLVAAAIAVLALPGPRGALADAALYEPQQADFACVPQQEAYGKGDCSAYFKWIQAFYKGNLLVKGWTDYVARLLSHVSPEARPRLITKANVVGRIIGAEWAKENAFRHIHSRPDQGYPNLQNLVERFDETVAKETGDGGTMDAFLDTVQRVAEKAARGAPLSDDERAWR